SRPTPLHPFPTRRSSDLYLAQESSVFRKFTVEQYLLGVMELLNLDRATRRHRATELLEQFGIGKLKKSKAGTLSGGERRRLEIRSEEYTSELQSRFDLVC